MKIQFIAGIAVGAIIGMLFIESCPKAQRVVKQGKRDVERKLDHMKYCGRKFGKKLCFR